MLIRGASLSGFLFYPLLLKLPRTGLEVNGLYVLRSNSMVLWIMEKRVSVGSGYRNPGGHVEKTKVGPVINT